MRQKRRIVAYELPEKPYLGDGRNFDGCYTTESLAVRLNVSKKFIVSHRQRIPGAMKIGRIWRFDKATVGKEACKGKPSLNRLCGGLDAILLLHAIGIHNPIVREYECQKQRAGDCPA